MNSLGYTLHTYSTTFTTTSAGTVRLTLLDQTSAVSGRDLLSDNIQVNGPAVPEPGMLVLLATGLLGLLCYAWRKRRCVPS